MYEYFQFYSPTKIVFGVGVSKDFSSEIHTLGVKKILVVSDKGVSAAGLVNPVVDVIRDAGVEVIGPYLDIVKDSPISAINKLAEFGRKAGVDSVLALGGGSVIDSAKAADILITHGGDLLADYAGVQTIPSRLKPLIVIPTTAGTGSEVTSAAVVLDQDAGVKHSFVDDFLKPSLAILDPSLTLKMPSSLTSSTGVDAFSHALEAFTSTMRSPVSDGLAIEALRLIKEFLIKVLDKPNDMHFRSEMMTAATIAGMAFDNAMVGVIHGIAHSLGGLTGLSHGEAIFLALPVGILYNMEVAKNRYAEIAKRLHIAKPADDDDTATRALWLWIEKWREAVTKRSHLAMTFKEKGVAEDMLVRVAHGAVADGTSFYNPREVVADQLLPFLCGNY